MSDETLIHPSDQEELRQQIADSRGSLVEKLEKLEEKVAESVHSATTSVEKATASVVETMQHATASVSETVDHVNSAVQGTVENVRSSVTGTVESVKHTFDLSHHIRTYPWASLAGAVLAGYLGGSFLLRRSEEETGEAPMYPSRSRSATTGDVAVPDRRERQWEQRTPAFQSETVSAVQQHREASSAESSGPGWTERLKHLFHDELDQLKGLAIGTGLALVRDAVSQSAPVNLKSRIAELVDDVTDKLGGQRIPGPVFGDRSEGESRTSGFASEAAPQEVID